MSFELCALYLSFMRTMHEVQSKHKAQRTKYKAQSTKHKSKGED